MTAVLMIAIVVASFLLGFARDLAIAWRFGGSWMADALFVCLVLPVFFENVLGVALRDSVIAYFNGRGEWGAGASNRIRQRLHIFTWTLGLAITATIWIGAELWLPLIAPGWSELQVAQSLTAFKIGAVLILIQTILYFQTALLHIRGQFLIPMSRTILLNIGALLALWIFQNDIAAVLTGMLSPLLILALFQSYALRRLPATIGRPATQTADGNIVRYAIPLLLAAIIQQFCIVSEKFFASFLSEGSIAHLAFAFRIATIPLTVFSLSYLSLAFPNLSTLSRTDDRESLTALIYRMHIISLILLVPASTLFISMPSPIISLLFGRGEFGELQVQNTAPLLALYAAGVPAMGFSLLGGRILIALDKGKSLVYCATALLIIVISLNFALYRDFGAPGLAASFTIGSWMQAVITHFSISRRSALRPIQIATGRWLCAALVAFSLLSALPTQESIFWLATYGILSIVLHLVIVALLGDREWLRMDFWRINAVVR